MYFNPSDYMQVSYAHQVLGRTLFSHRYDLAIPPQSSHLAFSPPAICKCLSQIEPSTEICTIPQHRCNHLTQSSTHMRMPIADQISGQIISNNLCNPPHSLNAAHDLGRHKLFLKKSQFFLFYSPFYVFSMRPFGIRGCSNLQFPP